MTDWFVPLGTEDGIPLFAFPQAGAGCAQLVGLAKALAPHKVALYSANLPGRQARIAEAPLTDFDTVVQVLADALCETMGGRPYGMLGHCGGALLSHGVLRVLAERNHALPQHFFVVSYDAPDIATRPDRLADLSSDALWTYLRSSGGVTPELAEDDRMRALTEPAIRADFTVLCGYRHRHTLPLPVPVTVCFGSHDTGVRRGALLGWRRQTTHTPRLHALDAGHWVLNEAEDELADLVGRAFTEGAAA
jgi:surfactin synthase thioesterase subunit